MTITASAFATPVHLRCEYRDNPLGIDQMSPRLSWMSDNSERNWKQAAYQVLVASAEERLQVGSTDIWDSGKIASSESIGIAYRGPDLESRKRYYWKVLVWDGAGKSYESSESAWWEMGLLHPGDWKAKWIRWQYPDEDSERAAIRWIWVKGQDPLTVVPKTTATFQLRLRLKQKPRDAALFVAVRGSFAARINGHDVGGKKHRR
jgi:alpha-L-rhamnosidase